ncbi:cyclin-dependent kinase 12-like isoform X2 [Oscarella lobularis]|uniref:cyclin-dependent kinase 12-like isoform X2 n=1 Tax=Oscarella lobularis TaxID=121494 RepID=UPI003314326D
MDTESTLDLSPATTDLGSEVRLAPVPSSRGANRRGSGSGRMRETPDGRLKHNVMEQQRRKDLRGDLKRLTTTLGMADGTSQKDVLIAAKKEIDQLKTRESSGQKEIDTLRDKKLRLETKLEYLTEDQERNAALQAVPPHRVIAPQIIQPSHHPIQYHQPVYDYEPVHVYHMHPHNQAMPQIYHHGIFPPQTQPLYLSTPPPPPPPPPPASHVPSSGPPPLLPCIFIPSSPSSPDSNASSVQLSERGDGSDSCNDRPDRIFYGTVQREMGFPSLRIKRELANDP